MSPGPCNTISPAAVGQEWLKFNILQRCQCLGSHARLTSSSGLWINDGWQWFCICPQQLGGGLNVICVCFSEVVFQVQVRSGFIELISSLVAVFRFNCWHLTFVTSCETWWQSVKIISLLIINQKSCCSCYVLASYVDMLVLSVNLSYEITNLNNLCCSYAS